MAGAWFPFRRTGLDLSLEELPVNANIRPRSGMEAGSGSIEVSAIEGQPSGTWKKKSPDVGRRKDQMAEREGFEPSKELIAPYSLSRRALSATQPPLRGMCEVILPHQTRGCQGMGLLFMYQWRERK